NYMQYKIEQYVFENTIHPSIHVQMALPNDDDTNDTIKIRQHYGIPME
ncbi:unnamed protein product, partial [Heterotrigona itama]